MDFAEVVKFNKVTMSKELKPIPEAGKEYHFWDDGKCGPARHYICRVERIVSMKHVNDVIIDNAIINWDDKTGKAIFGRKPLLDIWVEQKKLHDWVLTKNTDYFIEASCPTYDENNLWFVRSTNGGWFSMDIQSGWQGGMLDVTGTIFEAVINEWELEGCDTWDYLKATYENR